ncbi:hypothetical protein QC762_0056800 [Podospora pseudocomata]|uniref:Uncharacterized protein n=1 Tax=Podospora pseudocomata TaxID=2093779 RepID=A0ABR0GK65_9PEZI|nr:hypothetical protein QC762_0056800 [Podospora pseudocomata]
MNRRFGGRGGIGGFDRGDGDGVRDLATVVWLVVDIRDQVLLFAPKRTGSLGESLDAYTCLAGYLNTRRRQPGNTHRTTTLCNHPKLTLVTTAHPVLSTEKKASR